MIKVIRFLLSDDLILIPSFSLDLAADIALDAVRVTALRMAAVVLDCFRAVADF